MRVLSEETGTGGINGGIVIYTGEWATFIFEGPNLGWTIPESPAHPFDVDTGQEVACRGTLRLP